MPYSLKPSSGAPALKPVTTPKLLGNVESAMPLKASNPAKPTMPYGEQLSSHPRWQQHESQPHDCSQPHAVGQQEEQADCPCATVFSVPTGTTDWSLPDSLVVILGQCEPSLACNSDRQQRHRMSYERLHNVSPLAEGKIGVLIHP